MCNTSEVESVCHFVVECTKYESERASEGLKTLTCV